MPASVTKEPMSYKVAKQDNELVTKLRLIRRVRVDNWHQNETAECFRCHRNTVSNILTAFDTKIKPFDRERLLHHSFTQAELEQCMLPLKGLSTKPHHHPLQATKDQVDRVKHVFSELKVKVGPKRLQTMMRRKFKDSGDLLDQSLATIKLPKLKGIYKREGFKVEKARASSGSYRPLYDYTALACFEAMHFDTKHVKDKKALPPKVYDYFMEHLGEIPSYEWNLIDAKSRVRLTAYSHEINAEFGLKFLLFCLQFIRTMFNNINVPIMIGYDNGVEFCSGSPLKLADWNHLLNHLNAKAYAYNPYWDTRKNLIERSHRTDDEEFLIPRGEYIKTEEDFMREATNYGYYWNFQRTHSGIGMNDRTPFEVLQQSGILGAEQLMSFPVLLLDRQIDTLRRCTEPLLFKDDIRQTEAKRHQTPLDPKTLLDLSSKYDFFTTRAQKVLTYYHEVLATSH
jgi:hypothetical protein